MARTKKNLIKYQEQFFLFLKENLSLAQLEGITLKDALSLLLSANEIKIKRFELKRFFFNLGIRKIVQARNEIFGGSPDQLWRIKDPYVSPGEEKEYLRLQAERDVEPFDPLDFGWAGDKEELIEAIGEEGVAPDSDILLMKMATQNKDIKRDDFLFGHIQDLPEEYHPILKQELINIFCLETVEIVPPQNPLSNTEAAQIVLEKKTSREMQQSLFEMFRTVNKFITKSNEKKIFWALFLSPEISSMQLEKQFGLFKPSHLKITEAALQDTEKKRAKSLSSK